MKKLLVVAVSVSTIISQVGPMGSLKANDEDTSVSNGNTKDNVTPRADNPVLKGNIDVDVPLNIPMVAKDGDMGINMDLTLGNDKLPISFTGKDVINETIQFQGVDVIYDVTVKKEGDKITGYHVTLKDVPCNTYTITLGGSGYTTVKREVNLRDYSKGYSFANDKSFLVGDVSGETGAPDGQVNDFDYEAMLDAMDSTDLGFDLNRDGMIDIEDLNSVAQNIGVEKQEPTESLGSAIVNIENVVPKVEVETDKELTEETKNLTIENLFNDSEDSTTIGFQDETDIITTSNPISLQLVLEEPTFMSKVEITAPDSDAGINAGILIVEDVNGISKEVPFNNTTRARSRSAQKETIQIDLGEQVAVKKITIKVTGTKKESNLVEIAKVEFVNDVYVEVPEKEVNYPKNVKASATSGQIKVTWDEARNVGGYEVKYVYTDPNSGQKVTKTQKTTKTELTLNELDNLVVYTISVQSISDGWQSGYGPSVTATPFPTSAPKAPTQVEAESGFRSFKLTWAKSKETTSYNVYYRKKGIGEYKKVSNIKQTSYQIENIDNGEYEMYVSASNSIGESSPSTTILASTADLYLTEPYKYELINVSKGDNVTSDHIIDVTYPNAGVNSPKFDKFDIVDNDPTSYWGVNGNDAGGHSGSRISPIVEFDKEYTMKEAVVVPAYNQKYSLNAAKVYTWDANGEINRNINSKISQVQDKNGNPYYIVTFDKAVTAKKIEVNTGYTQTNKDDAIRIAEMMFYNYSTIESEIDSVYKDDLHLSLRDDVTAATLDKLEKDLDAKDPVSGEQHPRRIALKNELKYAREILASQELQPELFTVDRKVNISSESKLGFSMSLSDYQPLGISAKAGEQITVYMGADSGIGEYGVELISTQFQGSPYGWKQVFNLNPGKNTITIPKITQTKDEKGGALYIRYTKKAPRPDEEGKNVKLRVIGGTQIPYLNLSGLNEQEKETATAAYVKDLQTYVEKTLPEKYGNGFNSATSVLNTTEIMSDKTLLSLPADAVYKTIKAKGDASKQIASLLQNEKALEQTMDMAYNLEGLSSKQGTDASNKIPSTRANFRYATMIPGAGMYATSYHMGFTYGAAGGLVSGTPSVLQSDGKTYGGGNLYGWGVQHELGHVLDQKATVYQEISNNIFPLFAQKLEGKAETRVAEREEQVYAKVTSGATGGLSSSTGLAMFWQLHLAYDNEAVTPDNVSSFYSKYYTYLRTGKDIVGKDDNKDNLVIRAASEAAGKDLTEFFVKWGFVPNEKTKAHMKTKGYEKETRNIAYINDAASNYRLAGKTGITAGTTVKAELLPNKEGDDYKAVTMNLSTSKDQEKILGYEIKRNGEVVAFVKANKDGAVTEFNDQLDSMNNRAVSYEVTAIDYLLNETDTVALAPFKIKHDGTIAKTNWEVTSNVDADQVEEGSDQDNTNLLALKNNNYKDIYTGKTVDKPATPGIDGKPGEPAKPAEDVTFFIDMNKEQLLSGIKFTAGVEDGKLVDNTPKDYEVYTSSNNTNWSKVAAGSLTFDPANPTTKLYFAENGNVDEGQLGVFEAHYVKVVFKTKSVALSEIDLLAPPGDNVELIENGIGILKNDFVYDKQGSKIPKGSLVFNGKYRGNPAFNAVLLFDENDNNIVGASKTAGSIFMAQLPQTGDLFEVSDGNWIYWIEPGDFDVSTLPKKVYAELYRVDDAITLEGQRLVSDTIKVSIPENLPDIELKNGEGE